MKSFKKAFALILSLILVLSAIPFAASAETTDTTGWTPISSAADFKNIKNNTTGNYYLTQDIDFGGESFEYIVAAFDGVLDGNGYALYNFSFVTTDSTTNATYMGVFQALGLSGTGTVVKNLKIGMPGHEITATLNKQANKDVYFGYLAARGGRNDYRLVVENVDVYGKCTIPSTTKMTRYWAGGLLGYEAKAFAIQNVTFNGFIKDETTGDVEGNIGGIVTHTAMNRNDSVNILKNCINNATLSDATNGESKTERLSGMITYLGGGVLIQDCVNNGAITGGDQTASIASYIRTNAYENANQNGNQVRQVVILKDCRVTATASPANWTSKIDANNVGDKRPYVYITGSNNEDTTGVIEITNLTELQAIADAPNQIYRLKNDINLNGETFQNFVVNCDFAGIFDGNGQSIYNFSLTSETANDSGLFKSASVSAFNGSAILDLTVGSAEHKVGMTSANRNGSHGALLSKAGGAASGTYGPLVSGVTAYIDVEFNKSGVSSTNVGGIVGNNVAGIYDDCVTYGSVTVGGLNDDYPEGYIDVGGIAGRSVGSAKYGTVSFTNCVSLVDVNVTSNYDATDGVDEEENPIDDGEGDALKRVGGIVGTVSKGLTIVNCANLGDLTVNGTVADGAIATAGGIVGHVTDTNAAVTVVVSDCMNLGRLSVENGLAGGFVGGSNAKTKLVDNKQFGTVSGTITNNYSNQFDAAETPTYSLSMYNCMTGSALTMGGTSVRLSDPTGIRFKAVCDQDALAMVKSVADYDVETMSSDISYGMLIAPAKFVRAAGAFTKAALDAYETPDNVPAYVDVVSNGSFQNVEGQIAGSLVGINDMKDVLFTGRAYVSFTAGGESYVFYADGAQERSIQEVATLAYNDYLYEKEDAYYRYDTETEEYVPYTGKDVADYDVELGAVGDYMKLTPYNTDERALLAGFAGIATEG